MQAGGAARLDSFHRWQDRLGIFMLQQPLARSAMHRKSIVLRTLTLRVHGHRLSLAGTAAALAHVLLLSSTSR